MRAPDSQPFLKSMSQHPSLKSGGGSIGAKRSVLKRFERVKLMKKRGQWKDGQSAVGLPKTLPEE
jgi:small basic protein (TIGR04137 family)